MENQFQKVFEKAQYLFAQRKLDKALKKCTQSIEFAHSLQLNNAIVEANLLLSQIYNTLGIYEGKAAYFNLAQAALSKIQELIDPKPESKVNFYIQQSISSYHQNKNQLASNSIQQALDECQNHNLTEGTLRCQFLLCERAIENNEFKVAQQITNDCLDLLNNHSNLNEHKATLYNLIGRIQIRKQDIIETLKISKQALEWSRQQQDIENELYALNNLAIVHGIKSEYKEALEYLIEGLQIANSIGFRKQIARCKINMGNIYAHLFNYAEAQKHYQEVLQNHNAIIETSTEIVLLNNIGNINFDIQKNAAAESYFQKAYRLAKMSRYQEMEALSLAQLARTYRINGQFSKAAEKALEAEEILKSLGTVYGSQINLINLGVIAYQQNKIDAAIKYLSQGVVTSKSLKDDVSEIKAYEYLAKIFKEQGNLEQAYNYLQILADSKERFSKKQRNRQLLDLEIKYGIQEKQAEIERLKIENDYQSLLLQQKDQIETQNEQLKEINAELKQFASVVSHDLKEPLRMITSFAQLLSKKYESIQSDTESKEYLQYIVNGTKRMEQLLSGLMYYATIGKEEEETKPIDLTEIFDICCLHLRVSIQEAQARILYEKLPFIESKSSLLIQLFQNLLSNAIKFRKKDVTPIIHIDAKVKAESIIISLKDNGIGIEAKYQQHIFEVFRRLHRNDVYEGTGIGLAVCQKIVKRLNGKIWLESELGEGTTFFVQLPVSKEND